MKKDYTPEQRFLGKTVMTSFALLCLVLVSMLVLPRIAADRNAGRAVNAYYQADLEAEKIYAKLQAGETIEGVREEDGIYSYTCPISETSRLEVEVQERDGKWTILRWEQVETPPPEE